MKIGYITYPATRGGIFRNIGDRVIYRGAKNLLLRAIGPHTVKEYSFDDPEAIELDCDVYVVCGTPQLAAFSQKNDMLRAIERILESDASIKINLGAGSFYFNRDGEDAFLETIRTRKSLFEMYKEFDLVTTRDASARAALDLFGIPSALLPCPGLFATVNLIPGEPTLKAISVLGASSTFWNLYEGDIFAMYARFHVVCSDFIFVSHDYHDSLMLRALNIPFVEYTNEDDFLGFLGLVRSHISFRVHGSLPVWSMGGDTVLIGFDRRIYLGREFNLPIDHIDADPMTDLFDLLADMPFERKNNYASASALLRPYLAEYIEAIQHVFRRKIPEQSATPRVRSSEMLPQEYRREIFVNNGDQFDIPTAKLATRQPRRTLGDTAVISVRNFAEPIFFGPYIQLEKGQYTISIFITAFGRPNGARLRGRLQVVAGNRVELANNDVVVESNRLGKKICIETTFYHEHIHMLVECRLALEANGAQHELVLMVSRVLVRDSKSQGDHGAIGVSATQG